MSEENQNNNTPPTFTKEQQEFLNTLIGERIGKTKAQAEKEKSDAIAAAVAEKEAEIARLNDALKNKGGSSAEIEAEKAQMKALLEAEKLNTRQTAEQAKKNKELYDNLFVEHRGTIKGQVIREAMDAQDSFSFVEANVVRQLVDPFIVFDDDSSSWVVKQNGVVRQNSSLQPMSVKEYLAEFAAQHPYLVKGQVKSGTGSSESNRGGQGLGKVITKADLKTPKDKSDYITKFGYDQFAKLPAK